MMRYNNIIITTKEEDFRKIGLLPPLNESDDPSKPRDIPSPDPDTLGGLDDSEGDKSAHQAGAKQPKPKMGPAADDTAKAGMDPDEEGGSVGAQKGKGGASAVKGSKEASLKGESQYMKGKDVGLKGKGKNKGQKAAIARGLKPVAKVAGMSEGRFSKAASLIEDVQNILRSVQVDEEMNELMRGYRLVSENAALLSDRFYEVSDNYKVESLINQMEELSADAAEALDIIENELEGTEGGSDEADAVRHSSEVADLDEEDSDRDADKTYDIPSPAFKEDNEKVLNLMTSRLMEALETYDGILGDMGITEWGQMPMDEEGDDDKEVHLHTKAKRVHVHHGDDGDSDTDMNAGGAGADSDPDMDQDDGGDDDADADMHAGGADQDADGDYDDSDQGDDQDQDPDADQDGDDGDMDSDHDSNSLMGRMKALRARREAMGGNRPFRGGR